MAKKTPSFVTEIRLATTPYQERVLSKRLEAGRQVYNACLDETLRRLDLMRESKQWGKVVKMPHGERASKKQNEDRSNAFKEINKAFGFRKYDIHKYAQQFGHSYLGYHLDSQTIKKIASRAFIWVQQYLFDKKRGRPKFKRFGEFNSVETANNLQGIIYRDNKVIWNSGRNGKKIIIDTMIDDDPVTEHGLNCRIKYVRIVRRVINGKQRYYAQLINEGKPYKKITLGKGAVGLDLGPSTIAIVGPNHASLKVFCEEVEFNQKEIKRLQRKIDRQFRTNNPESNYNEKGQMKPGMKWTKSKGLIRNQAKLAEMKRKQAAHRKSLHGQLINQILQMGDVIKLEKINYVSWQKIWGKSIGKRAPGMFVARLRQKANDLGGLVDEFSTYNTKLSQLCHKCGKYNKVTLDQRWHKCECGIEITQRDLYSAFLATCIEDGVFNATIANKKWDTTRKLLQLAIEDIKLNKKEGVKWPASFGL